MRLSYQQPQLLVGLIKIVAEVYCMVIQLQQKI